MGRRADPNPLHTHDLHQILWSGKETTEITVDKATSEAAIEKHRRRPIDLLGGSTDRLCEPSMQAPQLHLLPTVNVQDLNPAFPANRGLKELHIPRNASITNGSVVYYRIVSWDWARLS